MQYIFISSDFIFFIHVKLQTFEFVLIMTFKKFFDIVETALIKENFETIVVYNYAGYFWTRSFPTGQFKVHSFFWKMAVTVEIFKVAGTLATSAQPKFGFC